MVETVALVVSAALVIDHQDRVLLSQRAKGRLKDLWEFPGGKCEPGEQPEETVIRELREELDIEISDPSAWGFASHRYPEFHLLLLLFLCRHVKGVPRAAQDEIAAVRWQPRHLLDQLRFPPANDLLIQRLMQEKPII
ncbi:(deoxy)nucleoside triphosphate pyrophosphohydrolase [Magnetococcales bacterium HHB-1]